MMKLSRYLATCAGCNFFLQFAFRTDSRLGGSGSAIQDLLARSTGPPVPLMSAGVNNITSAPGPVPPPPSGVPPPFSVPQPPNFN
uniref:Uncharacterized protein n=1 Tax=Romanomermis culicivorax TaxID=13658 RepID=A0A915ILY9_ROMCU